MTGTDRHTCGGSRDPPAKEHSKPAAGRGRQTVPTRRTLLRRRDLDLQPRGHTVGWTHFAMALGKRSTWNPQSRPRHLPRGMSASIQTDGWVRVRINPRSESPNALRPVSGRTSRSQEQTQTPHTLWSGKTQAARASSDSSPRGPPHGLEGRPAARQTEAGLHLLQALSVTPLSSDMISSWGKQSWGLREVILKRCLAEVTPTPPPCPYLTPVL